MIPQWIISLVVGFVVRQIKTYGETLDWKTVKTDVDVIIRAALPDWIEGSAVELAVGAIDILSGILTSDDLKTIAEKLLGGDVPGALVVFKDLIIKLIHPTQPVLAEKLVAACDAYSCSTSAV